MHVSTQEPDAQRLKKSTGIPRSFLTEVDDRNVPGVLQTPGGKLVVPTIDAYVLLLLLK